jgi:N-acetylneuraminic acid mutarotase
MDDSSDRLRGRATSLAAIALLALLAACGAPATSAPSRATDGQSPSATESVRPTAAPGAASTAAASGSAIGPWSRVRTSGSTPAAREDHTWTVDQTGRFAYLFGGRVGARVFGDLWRYDLPANRWTRLSPTGATPEARFGHTGNWVDGRGLVVWSGQAGSRFFSDLWAYDPASNRWRRLPAEGSVPAARYGSCASVGPDGRLWISHGFTQDTGRFSDTRAYDFGAGRWTDETPAGDVPVIRCLHDCLWAPDGRLVLYGGQTTGVRAIGDLWTLKRSNGSAAWMREQMPPLSARNLYAAAVLGGRTYVFGGLPPSGARLADLWSLDLQSLVWSELSPGAGPSGRSGASLITDEARSRLLLFGGLTDTGAVNDTWEIRAGSER